MSTQEETFPVLGDEQTFYGPDRDAYAQRLGEMSDFELRFEFQNLDAAAGGYLADLFDSVGRSTTAEGAIKGRVMRAMALSEIQKRTGHSVAFIPESFGALPEVTV
jgi:hypothetical protein